MYMIFSGGGLLSGPMFWVCVSFESACISSLFLFFALMFHSSYYVHDILRRWVVVLSHVLSMCFFWKCMYLFSFPILCPNVPLIVLCTWYSQRVSCCLVPRFEYVFIMKVHVFLLFPIHCPNVPLVVLCTWYSQRVSCCLVPCFEYVFLLRVHVFLLFSYSLP